MKLFCSTCEKEVTDNITVFENVDGVIVHCNECMYPLIFVGYDEPNWFGNNPDQTVADQLSLFDNSCECSSCSCSERTEEVVEDGEDEDYDQFDDISFTEEDLDLFEEYARHHISLLENESLQARTLLHKVLAHKDMLSCQ